MGQETELRLDLAPAAAGLLEGGVLSGKPLVFALRDIYFDTPGEDLRAAGFSLRVRTQGQAPVQIVKTVGVRLAARTKWERAVEDGVPVLDETTPPTSFLGRRIDALQPVFEVVVERRCWSVAWEGARIDVVLDRGNVIAGDRYTPLCEIGLALMEGASAALFSFARRLGTVAPLRLGMQSKAMRGYRLLEPMARAVKGEPIVLTTDTTVPDAFRIIADACLRQFRLNEMLLATGDEEALHQARVALRRLRSALWVYKAMLEDDAFARLKDELKWLAGILGAVRDLDVLIARCKDDALRETLASARQSAFFEAWTALEAPRARMLMLDLAEWLACGEWRSLPGTRGVREQPLPDFAAGVLDRLCRKVRKGGRGLAGLDDEARHAVRKDAKKLRYAAEFFASLFDRKRQKRRHGAFLAALEVLQDQLGVLNDAAAMPLMLAQLGLAEDMAAQFSPDTARKRRRGLEAAVDAYETLVDAKRFWR